MMVGDGAAEAVAVGEGCTVTVGSAEAVLVATGDGDELEELPAGAHATKDESITALTISTFLSVIINQSLRLSLLRVGNV